MKKTAALLLILLMTAWGMTAYAASSVTFQNGAEHFVFVPNSPYSDTDLFENYKKVMPGDVLTQRITVRNITDSGVRIYLRAEPVDEKDIDFLSRMNLQVSTRDGLIFDAAASEIGGLTENVLLGNFRRNSRTQLTLTLTVPYDLDNEHMLTMGTIPWTFTAEVYAENPDGDTPHTGDAFHLSTWLLAAGMICGAIAWVLWQMKRQRAQ